jgi:hypothetical protein
MRTCILVFAFCLRGEAACEPTPEIQAEFQKAAALAAAVSDPFGALDKAAPFLAVRDRHPGDLFAHERYQDAIVEYGIEGHLRLLGKQYEDLDFKHPGDPMYHYLYLRTLAGRTTFGAIQGLNDLLASYPDFAPAHRTLAEIYATETFRDAAKEKLERERYLAACPGGEFTHWPPSIPDPSPLIEQAERLFAEDADLDRVIAMTIQGLKEFEWRSQRIRAFDWFSLDYKRTDAAELRGHYWRAWTIQVRAHRKAGRTEQAEQLLRAMDRRASLLPRSPGAEYWSALQTLARLYAEANQRERASEKLGAMRKYLDEHPDSARAAELDEIRKTIEPRG